MEKIIYSDDLNELKQNENFLNGNWFKLLEETFGGDYRILTNKGKAYRLELIDLGTPGTNFRSIRININK